MAMVILKKNRRKIIIDTYILSFTPSCGVKENGKIQPPSPSASIKEHKQSHSI